MVSFDKGFERSAFEESRFMWGIPLLFVDSCTTWKLA